MYCVSLNKFLCLLYAIFSCNFQQIFIKFGFLELASNSSDLDRKNIWKNPESREKFGIFGPKHNTLPFLMLDVAGAITWSFDLASCQCQLWTIMHLQKYRPWNLDKTNFSKKV